MRRVDGRMDGEGGNRTHDTTIFSRVLYQLSYLAWEARAGGRAAGRLATGGRSGLIALGRGRDACSARGGGSPGGGRGACLRRLVGPIRCGTAICPEHNALRTVGHYGTARFVEVRSLGDRLAIGGDAGWLAAARPLGPGAPALGAEDVPALAAGPARADRLAHRCGRRRRARGLELRLAARRRHGRDRARRPPATERRHGASSRFLLGLDLDAAARFHTDGTPVDGRAAQGDAAGWVAAAARAVGLPAPAAPPSVARSRRLPGGRGGRLPRQRDRLGRVRGSGRSSGHRRGLVRRAVDPASGLDSAAAWAVRRSPTRALPACPSHAAAPGGRERTLRHRPVASWAGGGDPWTAPTAWTAWGLAALGERRAALHLMAELRRAATPAGMLPERVDADTGVPTSTTPLAWSHAFAILALRQLWP